MRLLALVFVLSALPASAAANTAAPEAPAVRTAVPAPVAVPVSRFQAWRSTASRFASAMVAPLRAPFRTGRPITVTEVRRAVALAIRDERAANQAKIDAELPHLMKRAERRGHRQGQAAALTQVKQQLPGIRAEERRLGRKEGARAMRKLLRTDTPRRSTVMTLALGGVLAGASLLTYDQVAPHFGGPTSAESVKSAMHSIEQHATHLRVRTPTPPVKASRASAATGRAAHR